MSAQLQAVAADVAASSTDSPESMRAAEDFVQDVPSFESASDFASLASGLSKHMRNTEAACAALQALTAICRKENRGEIGRQTINCIVRFQLTCLYNLSRSHARVIKVLRRQKASKRS